MRGAFLFLLRLWLMRLRLMWPRLMQLQLMRLLVQLRLMRLRVMWLRLMRLRVMRRRLMRLLWAEQVELAHGGWRMLQLAGLLAELLGSGDRVVGLLRS